MAQQTTRQEGCGGACSSLYPFVCMKKQVLALSLVSDAANVFAPKSRATSSTVLPSIWVIADMRRSQSSPSPLLRTRCSIDDDNEMTETQEDDNSNLGGLDSEALWKTAVEVIRGVSDSLSQEEEHAKANTRRCKSPQSYECDEEETYSQGMRNLLLSLEKNFESEVTTKQSNTSNSAEQDPVVSVLQKSLSLSKTQKKKKKRHFRSARQPSNDFCSRLPDIDEDMSLHVTPSLEEEFHPPLMDTSIDSSSSADEQRLRFIEAELPPQEEGDSSWKKQVRVQSQLPNVEVLLLRRASSLARAGSLRSTHSLTPSIRSYCTSHDGSASCYTEYEDDEDDFSAFTRLHSFNSLHTSTSMSAHSYAFQEVDEEDDILADCSSFSWFGK